MSVQYHAGRCADVSTLSCMFSGEDTGCSSGSCVLTMCCMSIILCCVFPSDSHVELIEAVPHSSVFKSDVKFFLFFSSFFFPPKVNYFPFVYFQMIIVIKGFMASGRSVLLWEMDIMLLKEKTSLGYWRILIGGWNRKSPLNTRAICN